MYFIPFAIHVLCLFLLFCPWTLVSGTIADMTQIVALKVFSRVWHLKQQCILLDGCIHTGVPVFESQHHSAF